MEGPPALQAEHKQVNRRNVPKKAVKAVVAYPRKGNNDLAAAE